MRAAVAVGLLLVVTGCDSERPSYEVVYEPTLNAAGSCGDLEQTIEQLAIREMNADIDAILDDLENRETSYGRDALSVPAAAPTPTGAAGPTDYTTTNTQERDVDEPDFVKNDGTRIFVLQGRLLLGLGSWPPESTRIVSQTPIEGQPEGMLLDRNRLVVFSSVYLQGLGTPQRYYPYPVDTRTAVSIAPPYQQANAVKVTVFDVASAAPSAVEEQYLEGAFLDARRSGSSVRVVSVAGRRGPELVYWPERDVDWSNLLAARSAIEKLRSENVRRIRKSVLADWLPRAFTAVPGGLRETQRECSSFAATDASLRLGFTTVSTIDLSKATTDHTTMLAETQMAYASPRSLYLVAPHEWHRRRSETNVREDHSYLFQFDLASDAQRVRHVGAGSVRGSVLDAFSMDEENGFLRVATTRRTWLGWQLKSTTNAVSVLQASGGGRITEVGELTGLAREERIYSARFEGARGFLVTFRQIDPLFTLDLADPRHPRAAGELKVPGYSTYLHLLDANDLLTVGREVSSDGRQMGGVQLQVFDVSNFAQPAVRHRYVLGTRSSSSEAEYDHKAFTYFPARGLLALPFSDWSAARRNGFTSTLELLSVSASGGIAPLGSIDHSDLVQAADPAWPGFTPQIRRSVMADDYVYSISQGGLKVHDTRQLARTLATVPFPEPQ